MTLFDALPLLASIQGLIILGYLLVRRRASFGNEVAQIALFSALGIALMGEVGASGAINLPGSFARIAAVAWVITASAAVLFSRNVLHVPTDSRQGWPALFVIPAVALALMTTVARSTCEGSLSCTTWPRIEAAWGAVALSVSVGLIGRKLVSLHAVLMARPKGQVRIVAVQALMGVMVIRTLETLAFVASPEFARGNVAAVVGVAYVLLMQGLVFSLTRLYPESEEDGPIDLAAAGQINRFRRHLAQAVVFEEGGVGPLVRGTMLTTILTVGALVGWAAVTPVKEVAVTNGQVVPSSFIRPVQHLEGGIVQEVPVREGQLVEKGEILVRLDPAQALSELEQMRAREAGLLLRAERLRAFAEGRAPDFSVVRDDIADKGQALDQGVIFLAQERARDSAELVLDKQIEQRRTDITLYQDQISAMNQQIDLLAKEVEIRRHLVEKELTSKVVYFNILREFERLKGERARFQGQLKTAREALAEAENRIGDQKSKLSHDAYNEMGTVTAELAQLHEARSKLEDRVMRLEITSPARGIVQELSVTSPGAVIQAGGMVTKIVPVDDKLLVENQITPRDVGHVEPGQVVRIKVGSYDFARFGAVGGTLEQVSPSTFLDEKKQPYYKGLVALDRPYVGENPSRNHILPGMTVQVDIVTGEKTILQYLLKPIYLAATQAFQER
ncbi:Type I secretion membrane fusion protein [Candidatus Terasakiella magnetica]|nr:Type I secretion membrane fusion protein [Candidatus Terasakiella magnetica]